MKNRSLSPRTIAITAIMTAVVYALTRLVQIGPTPAQGYVHLGDAALYFASFAFGPWIGAMAGGLGTALVDATSGYAQWAIPSLVVHGIQGFAAGWIAARRPGLAGMLVAVVVGGVILVGGYFLAGTVLVGAGGALGEVVPNIFQGLAGAVVGIPLFQAVYRAYPALRRSSQAG